MALFSSTEIRQSRISPLFHGHGLSDFGQKVTNRKRCSWALRAHEPNQENQQTWARHGAFGQKVSKKWRKVAKTATFLTTFSTNFNGKTWHFGCRDAQYYGTHS